jgi:hypothetical protein
VRGRVAQQRWARVLRWAAVGHARGDRQTLLLR